jgi:hypothetical protein
MNKTSKLHTRGNYCLDLTEIPPTSWKALVLGKKENCYPYFMSVAALTVIHENAIATIIYFLNPSRIFAKL